MSRVQQRQKSNKLCLDFPSLPGKLYFSIGEASRLCLLEQHVLRYWEQEFPQLSPAKRRGNRRYYQKEDILLIRRIKELLYVEGFTIEGAKNKLRAEKKVKQNIANESAIKNSIKENPPVVVQQQSEPQQLNTQPPQPEAVKQVPAEPEIIGSPAAQPQISNTAEEHDVSKQKVCQHNKLFREIISELDDILLELNED